MVESRSVNEPVSELFRLITGCTCETVTVGYGKQITRLILCTTRARKEKSPEHLRHILSVFSPFPVQVVLVLFEAFWELLPPTPCCHGNCGWFGS